MAFGTSMPYGSGHGFGGGSQSLFFSQTQLDNGKAQMYMDQNIGVAPADQADTDDAYMYMNVNVEEVFNITDWGGASMYMEKNVGVEPAQMPETDDASQYMHANVEARPVGSDQQLPPTLN